MADDKNGRENQAQNADRRQRERAIEAELERGDEPEPPIQEADLGPVQSDLEAMSFPATGSEVVAAVGDAEVESDRGKYAVEDLVPDAEAETFEEPSEVLVRVARPTVATAMKRIVEAADSVRGVEFGSSQREGYERTFRELRAIDAVDEDEGIDVVADWVVEQIHEKEKLPGSRGVRRRAAKYCRANGYEVRNDEWLGV